MDLDGRFPPRRAGSSFGAFIVDVFEPNGTDRKNLTGFTATYTFRKASGGVAVIDAVGNTNTPGVGGTFEYQSTVAQMSSTDEYVVTVSMTLDGGEVAVRTYGFELLPAF